MGVADRAWTIQIVYADSMGQPKIVNIQTAPA